MGEQEALARWSGWGAVPGVFDEDRGEWDAARRKLRALAGEDGYAAARRTTINAHYTDPAYVREIWAGLGRLGFEGGRVLEPGCGSGTFIGLAPPTADMVGVELDPSTARVAQALYPAAEIRAESFAKTRAPEGFFDLAVGNVPFANVVLHDPRHNRGGHSLHNHFILKSLALTRPGGVVAVLTSSYTLDARNPAARREMSEQADLVGAVRLPNGAHRRAAGTEALTDLLILRRRDPGTEPADRGWESTREVSIGGQAVRVNSYFLEHPDHVLGELEIGRGAHHDQQILVRAEDLEQTPAALAGALADITTAAERSERSELTFTHADVDRQIDVEAPAVALAPAEGLWDGHLTAHPDGTFTTVIDGHHEPLVVPRSQHLELRALLALRDQARKLLSLEAASLEDTPRLDELRGQLRAGYDAYQQQHGPINRFTTRATGRTDPETGQPKLARVTPRVMSTLRSDPFAALVQSLEVFDESSQTAAPATLLTERVVLPREPVRGTDTPQDALAVCLDTHGRVELSEIARLLGVEEPEAREQLAGLVYSDPATGGALVPAAEYLSGNVREKLEHARAAAGQEPGLRENVQALEAVVPADLGMDDVQARLGAAWIDAGTHQAFLSELLADPGIQVEHPGGAVWEVRGNTHSLKATSEWGTRRMAAPAIAKAVLEQRPVQVTDDAGDGRRVLNAEESAAAQEKAQAIQERFGEWVWEDPDRGRRLLAEYNRRFNSIVLRDYTHEGERLTLPGLARTFEPRAHQRTAVARMLAEPAVGLFHQVGAGKTAEMVIGTMELRRLGMARKPAVVVPNHMLEQFSREWLQLYPQARLLAASSQDLAGDKRRAFIARAATNDWDAVLVTRSAFERLPMSPQAQDAYLRREIDGLRGMLENARQGSGLTVKRLEKAVLAAEQRLEGRLDTKRDPGITFEQTGIDYLVVDEMHDYKNLQTPSNIRDAAIAGSKRATDLHMKVEHLREVHGDRVITAATATPIANSITEAHVMQRYLRPDLLEAAGVASFDAWAATFGQTVTEIEMAPTGGGNFRQQTRFARFQNVPEMLKMWHVFADVKTAEDLGLPTPDLEPRPSDGQRAPSTVVIEASPEIRDYVRLLGERAEAVRARTVEPERDNMLKISTDGRKAALDIRLVTGRPPEPGTPSKLETAAANIASIHARNQARVYTDPATGEASPVTGGLQIVFCDLGTPGGGWNAYDELRDQLTQRGVPREQVHFIHDAGNDAEKARLFAACRAGRVSVLVGSTQKMGVGTNIQARAIALHHLDCPWRPADVEQRDGRILRQGNQNPEIGIYRYAVEGSFDAYSWQTVERKAKFIGQIMRGRLDSREIEDIGDNALSFAEVKALASGDPLILQKAEADTELTRLQRLERAHGRNRNALTATVAAAEADLERLSRQIPAVYAAAASAPDLRGDQFRITIDGRELTDRADAGQAIATWVTRRTARQPAGRWEQPLGHLGQIAGIPLHATVRRDALNPPSLEIRLADLPTRPAVVDLDKLRHDPTSAIRQLEHRVADLPDLAGRLEHTRDDAGREREQARDGLSRPFKYAEQLDAAHTRSNEITAAMQNKQSPSPGVHDQDRVDPDLERLRRLRQAANPTRPTPGRPGAAVAEPSRRPVDPDRGFGR